MSVKFDLNTIKNNFKKYENINSELVLDFCKDVKPMVSIMIPTFKRPHLVKETIDSAVNQKTDIKFEVVIIDNDAGKEFELEMLELVNSYNNCNVRYFRNKENIGMFGNWNRCIELARGERLTILNDDDLLASKWLDYVYPKTNGCELIKVSHIIFEDIKKIDVNYLDVAKDKVERLSVKSLFTGNINFGSLGLLLNREACISIGGFNEGLYPTCDYDFILRYVHRFGGVSCKNELTYYRWGGQ